MRGMKTSRISQLGLLVGVAALMLAPGLARAASVNIGSPIGLPGTQVTVGATLSTEGASINGVQNDISFDAINTPIAARPTGSGNCSITTTTSCTTDNDCPDLPTPFTGKEPCVNLTAPDCSVNASLGKGGFFAFTPENCSGTACTGVRAVILALDNTNAIPDGSTLYTCHVDIAPSAALNQYALDLSGTVASDTNFQPACGTGGTVPACGGTGGMVTVTDTLPNKILVCDVAPSGGNDAGQFGNGSINNADIVAIFRASLLSSARPPAGTARFSGMDSITEDSPPTCGGTGDIKNNDVVACFRRSLLSSLPRYDRQGVGASCTSSLHQ